MAPATPRVWRMQRAGSVVSRDELMMTVWNTTFWTSSKTIDVHLGWVRRKLGDDPSRPTLITTVRGHGLRFELDGPGSSDVLRSGDEATARTA